MHMPRRRPAPPALSSLVNWRSALSPRKDQRRWIVERARAEHGGYLRIPLRSPVLARTISRLPELRPPESSTPPEIGATKRKLDRGYSRRSIRSAILARSLPGKNIWDPCEHR